MDYGTILKNVGFKLLNRGNYWQTSAIFRDGDNPTAIRIYKNSGVWTDFVKGGSYPFELLLKKTLKTNDLSKFNFEKQTFTERGLLKEEKIYGENCLGKLLPDHSFYQERGILVTTLKKFQGGVATNGKLYNRYVFPIRNKDGKIHGFAGRRLVENEQYCKWLNWGKSSNWYYPYFSVKECREKVDDLKEIILVESIGDSMACFQAGYENTAVAFTRNVSPFLLSAISVASEKIIISLNGDAAGIEGGVKTFIKLSKVVDIQNIYFLPPPSDFGEMEKGKIKTHFSELNHKLSFEVFFSHVESASLTQEEKRQLMKISKEFKFIYG